MFFILSKTDNWTKQFPFLKKLIYFWIPICICYFNKSSISGEKPLIKESVEEKNCYTLRWCSVWFGSVTQSGPTLCNPMDYSMPGLPFYHQLAELAQTHVHQVSDDIQPSHPLSSPSPPAFNLSQQQGLFQWVSSSHQVAKVLEFQLQHQSFQWMFRTDFLLDRVVGSPCSPRDSQESSPTSLFKSINSLALSLLYSPNFTSIHDHWKNHSLN